MPAGTNSERNAAAVEAPGMSLPLEEFAMSATSDLIIPEWNGARGRGQAYSFYAAAMVQKESESSGSRESTAL